MVDWLTAALPVAESARELDWAELAGCTMYCKPGGEVERVVDRWLDIKGSYDSGMRARLGSAGLWLSGSPAKFLTGQNVDGWTDASWCLEAVRRVCSAVPGLPVPASCAGARLTRVDLTESYDLGRIERVREVLRAIAHTARARHQGRSHTAYQTVYFGQHSRRHSIKLYAKGDELAAHPPVGLCAELAGELGAQADGLLRVEVTIRGQQLRDDGLDGIEAWKGETVAGEQWRKWWGRVEMSAGVELLQDEVLALPKALRRTYELWAMGKDVFELMGRGTAYRHRRRILEETHGKVDVFALRPRVQMEWEAGCDVRAVLDALPLFKASGPLAEWLEQAA